MKKLFKWFFILIAAVVILILVAALALPYILPMDKIKNYAAEKMSETLNREVKLGKISFNIFKGFKLEDLYIGNRKGFSKKPFVSADAIELQYDLLSILRGNFNIGKIALVKPAILIERSKSGEFNFSDLTGAKAAPKKKEAPKKKKAPVEFLISSFSISKGDLTFLDYTDEGVKESGFKNFNLDVSGITLKPLSPISFRLKTDAIYQGKPIPAGLKGTIALGLAKKVFHIKDLVAEAAGDSIRIKGSISNWGTKSPDINISLLSSRVKIDNFLNIFGGSKKPKAKKEKPPYGTLTRKIDRSTKRIPAGLKVKGNISLANIQYKDLNLEKLNVDLSLENKVVNIVLNGTEAYQGKLSGSARINLNTSGLSYALSSIKLDGFDATPATNGFVRSFLGDMENSEDLIDKVEGKLYLSLNATGRGVETPDIIKNIKGNGVFTLRDGMIKKMKSLEGIADKIKLSMLKKDMEIQEFKCVFSTKDGIFKISDLYAHNGNKGDLKFNFKGSANMKTLKFVPGNLLTLKTSPRVTPKDLEAFTDKDGWGVFEFELTGALKKPIPIPKLGKPIEKVTEKAKESIKKEADEKAEELKEQLKEEGEEKLKELFNF